METNKKPLLSTKEWVMVIVIIVMAQLLLHFWASETMDSSQVVNYFSFAGTITSIILAVLAIIYSFVQSISQQSSAEMISREVNKLTDVTNRVDDSASGIASSIERMPELIDKLNNLPDALYGVFSEKLEKVQQITEAVRDDSYNRHLELIEKLGNYYQNANSSLDSLNDDAVQKSSDFEDDAQKAVSRTWLSFSLVAISIVLDKPLMRLIDMVQAREVNMECRRLIYSIYLGAKVAQDFLELIEVLTQKDSVYYINGSESSWSLNVVVRHLCRVAGKYVSDSHFDEVTSSILIDFIGEPLDGDELIAKIDAIALPQ